MSETGWYSGMARFIVSVGDVEEVTLRRTLFLVEADGFEGAQAAVIERALREETEYTNSLGEVVSWRMVDVETLDFLGGCLQSGCEVYSEPGSVVPRSSVAMPLRPEMSKPTQTGVLGSVSLEGSVS